MDERSGRSARGDHADAAALAAEAGALLLTLRAEGASGAVGDARSHALLMDGLARLHPDDAVLSEEGVDDGRRTQCARVWIVDPLDGTREFSEGDRVDWAVHVALVVKGRPEVGAVALPAQDRLLRSDAPPRRDLPPVRPRLVVSRTRPPAWTADVARALDADLLPMGSAGAKIAAVVTGEADVYIHAGGQYEWDSAAPVAVAVAAGMHASRLDGAALTYNHADPFLPDLVVCHPSLARLALDAVDAALDVTNG